VIAECLARPLLAERLITESYVHDQRFHGQLKRRAEAELKTHPSVRQIKRSSGMYTETEWIKTDSAETSSAPDETKTIGAIKMNGSDWQESVKKLAADFGNTKAGDAWSQIKTGVLSPLQEDEGHYYAVAVMKMEKDRLKLATIAWLKEPLRSWLAKAETQVPVTMAAISANYALPVIASPSVACTDDTWTPTSLTNAPTQRFDHTAVWTGSEMIVWGGSFSVFLLNTGGRYNPSTDSWTATSNTGAPSRRTRHTAVWTGTEMIVWGGLGFRFVDLNTGGRYNPGTDSWTATSTTGAPGGRRDHTAVWTGTRMIVWGGGSNTGGRYNPSIDSWQSTSTTGAPSPRSGHTAVSADGQMIVWGGESGQRTGGRYNPVSDSWTATSTTGAPTDRGNHTAVWTGSEMIVWGGSFSAFPLNTGGRYNPSTDSWTATSTTGAPSRRTRHTAVWTVTEMIVWGGQTSSSPYFQDTGGRYDPSTDSWTATSTTSVPSARANHTAVWTGGQMIVWGGYRDNPNNNTNTGGRYCPRGTSDAVAPAVSVATP
jgi:N-acetylneuraminic acid mutarotase